MSEEMDQIQSLPLELQVGQLFIVQPDPELAFRESLKDHLDYFFGGFFGRPENIRSIRNTRGLTRRMRDHWRKLPPAIIAIDEEGGLVSDTGHLTTPAPSAAALGELDDVEVTEDVYHGIGRKLRALGFNTVFAPVLDVNSAEGNPVIGTRAFGSTARHVTKHGLAALRGLRQAGVVSCAKHFPGHGATTTDSHKELPVVDASRDVLTDRDLAPFAEAVEQVAPDMIMTAHVTYKAFDARHPATISHAVLNDLLRGELRYQGLIVTDAMEMEGISRSLSPGDAALKAMLAGADLLLYAHDRGMAKAAHGALVEAVRKGDLPKERLSESLDRILKLRESFRSRSWFGSDEAREALELSEESLFFEAALGGLVLEGNVGALGEIPKATGPKLIILPRGLDERRRLRLNVVREQLEPAGFSLVEVGADPSDDEIAEAKQRAAEASVIVVGTVSRGTMTKRARGLVKAVTERDVIKVGVALLDPGDTEAMMGANCRIKTFGFAVPQLWALCQKLTD